MLSRNVHCAIVNVCYNSIRFKSWRFLDMLQIWQDEKFGHITLLKLVVHFLLIASNTCVYQILTISLDRPIQRIGG